MRLDLPGGKRFGPGKAALLQAISRHGSIRAAAESLSMSYPKALKLIEQMNADFQVPLIESHHGGKTHGGSELTDLGHEILRQYDDICRACETSAQPMLKAIQTKLA
ncbi:MAG: LysR family transcriptional regulator [Pseudomonadota bacterium]